MKRFGLSFVAFFIAVSMLTACGTYQDKAEEVKQFLSGAKEEADRLVGEVFSEYEGLEGYDIDEATIFDGEAAVESGSVDRVLETHNIHTLCAQIGGSTLEILVSEDGNTRLVTENAGKFQVFQKEGQLFINATGNTKSSTESSIIRLFLPADIQLQDMDLQVGAGQIIAKGLLASTLTASVGAGEIILEDCRIGQLDVNVGMGNFKLSGTVENGAKAVCAMGNLELGLNGAESDYDYDLSCVAGNIKIGSQQYSTGVTKEQRIDHNTGRLLALECSMGNIVIRFP